MATKAKHSVEYYKDGAGEWRSRIVHQNGNVILDSGEGYKRIEKCITAMNNFLDELKTGDKLTYTISREMESREKPAPTQVDVGTWQDSVCDNPAAHNDLDDEEDPTPVSGDVL